MQLLYQISVSDPAVEDPDHPLQKIQTHFLQDNPHTDVKGIVTWKPIYIVHQRHCLYNVHCSLSKQDHTVKVRTWYVYCTQLEHSWQLEQCYQPHGMEIGKMKGTSYVTKV